MSPRLQTLQLALDRPSTDPPGRVAAVAAVLLPDDELLFMRRSERADDPWSGHLCFPGGRRDPGDADSLATAIRETREELGLDLTDAQHLGALADVDTGPHSPSLVVRPWVFRIDRLPPLTLNYEVASIHTIPLSQLEAGVGRATFPYVWQGTPYDLPCIDFDGVRLWGLTLRMVDDLVHRLGRL